MTTSTPPPGRLASIDLLRGLTMAAMIVVNNPGTWSHMYPSLRHAAWGETLALADLIFPMFLFLVGVSVSLALVRRDRADIVRPALRRSAELFLIGVGLNLFPEFDFATLRIPGVLQRIAVVYLCCVLAWLAWGQRGRVLALVALLAGYTVLLAVVPVPGVGRPLLGPELSLPVWLDETLLGAHTWRGPGDPEGLLSTLPAVATGLLGVVTGSWLRTRPSPTEAARRLAPVGTVMLAAGWAWSLWQPAVKELWTGSYVLITGGWMLLALAACVWAVDGRGWQRGLGPVMVLGRHALTAFVAAHLLSDLAVRVVRWPDPSLHHFIQRRLLAGWLPDDLASLVQSLGMLVVIVVALVIRERLVNRPPPSSG